MIGRRPGAGDGSGRWAWTAQIFDTEPKAAYRAMCSLFLRPSSAWLFDGYPHEGGWAPWDVSAAAKVLEEVRFRLIVNDTPDQGLTHWLQRASHVLDAELIMVNSKGNRGFFELLPGRGRPGDVPFTMTPFMIHIVHSWSAVAPANRNSVAARWLERGAYAYCGSVQEPQLQGFLPTPSVAMRLASGAPWAAAVRHDVGSPWARPWRITVFGDPLAMLGPPSPRTNAELPLTDTTDLDTRVRATIRNGRYETAFDSLTLLGRDADAARLAAALLKDDPGKIDPAVARAGLFAAMRAGDDDTFIQLYRRLTPEDGANGMAQDALWHTAPRLARARGINRDLALALLRQQVREDQREEDEERLSRLMGR